jgi:hypothetical protein
MGCGTSGFDSGVATADDNDIKIHAKPYPIASDISSLISWFNSTAYSIGSSFEKGSMKPMTIIWVAALR